MNYQRYLNPLRTLVALLPGLILITGCSSNPEKQYDELDPALVTSMKVRIQQASGQFKTKFENVNFSSHVSDNLSQAGYPLSKDDENNYSHQLDIRIGEVKLSSTPAGFSFNAGNSDPRALDFQKADVLPLTCQLISKDQPQQRVELTMDFTAKHYLADIKKINANSKISEQLVNDMSTVCYNLLSNLNVNRQLQSTKNEASEPNVTTKTKPKWMPEYEIRTIEETPIKTGTKQQAQTIQAVKNSDDDPEVSPKTKKPVETTKSVNVKSGKNKQRKQLIIHNQGSPVTIDFGFERK